MQQVSFLVWDEFGSSFWVVQTRACAPETFAWTLVMVGTILPERGKLDKHC